LLLAVDVGNTQTVFGLFEGARLAEHWRVATDSRRTGDELGVILAGFLDFDAVGGVCLSSSVPALVRSYQECAERWAKAPILVLAPGVRTGIGIRYDDPRDVGPDRIANAVAAADRYGGPCIVVDFGTSTNFDALSAEGDFVGGVLAPGVEISIDALFARAARLTRVDLAEPPTVIGKTTAASLQAGLLYGFAGLVDGIVGRMQAELGGAAHVVATGGLAELIAPHASSVEGVDPFLTLEGLRIVWERNSER
jgi:type III pantothenate kinase